MNRSLRISKGASRLNPVVRSGKISWAKLCEKLLDFVVTPETYAEYMAMPADQQADIKDVGYLVGGPFEGKARRKNELICRSIVTLDVDHCDDINALLEAYAGYECVVHSTHKHSPDRPRLRVVFPLARDVSPFEYEPVARNLADWFGMDYFDDTTFEVSRIMYWPSCSSDAATEAVHLHGDWINPDDWAPDQDHFDWPRSSRVGEIRPPVAEAADPLTRPGLIGAFNRTYDIHAAIATYLPEVFETTEFDNRYRPLGATGPAGAVVYDDQFLYSHHENPAAISQKNCNAFDLVRMLLFGDDDHDASMKEMYKLVAADPEVLANRDMDDELDDIDEAAEKSKPSAPTVDQFRAEIEEMVLPAGHESAHLDSLLPRIAQYEPHETDMLLKALQARYPVRPGIQTLRDSVKRIRTQLAGRDGEEVTDIERELVDEMLEEHFAGGAHLKRIGRAFWLYETGVWRMIGDEPIRGLLQESIIRLRETRPDDAAQLVAAIGENKTTTLVGSLNSMLTARLARASELSGNSDPLLLLRRITQPVVNCLNCELHFDYHGNMTVEDHNPEHFYTMQVNTDYDPGADCPEWDRFMRMVFAEAGDPEDMIRHLEELGGYIISMSKWLKVWVLFHGATNTGKSTLLNVFKELLGKSCVAMELGKFGVGSDFADYNLVNALLLADDDFDKSASLPDGFIKKISEEKRITANVKFKDAITFQSRALPLVCANHWPVTKDVSDAFHERALVFEFLHRIDGPERSDARRDAMLLELPGILNRFIAGLQRLRTRNNWDVPVDAVISHEKWSSQSNQVMQFVDEMLMPGKRVKRSDVWRAYTDWVPHKGFMLRQRELYDRLDMLLGASVKSHGIDVWTGWELRPPPHLDSPHEEL